MIIYIEKKPLKIDFFSEKCQKFYFQHVCQNDLSLDMNLGTNELERFDGTPSALLH